MFGNCCLYYFLCRNIFSQICYTKSIIFQHECNQILADIMNISFNV